MKRLVETSGGRIELDLTKGLPRAEAERIASETSTSGRRAVARMRTKTVAP